MTEKDSRPDATPIGGFEFNRPTIVGLLYLGSLITGVSGLIGLVLAYVWKGEPHQPWEEAHYVYLIRTFWIGLAALVAGLMTVLIGTGVLICLAAGLWVLVRTLVSLIKAQNREAVSDPRTWLI